MRNQKKAKRLPAPTTPVAQAPAHYFLRLFVTGTTPRSTRAIVNTRRICEEYLPGCYELEIIDIAQHPARAAGEQLIAAPTLIRTLPLPERRFIGDMSQTERLVQGLDLRAAYTGNN